MTQGCGLCGYKGIFELVNRRDYLNQKYHQQNSIPSDHWDEIDRLTKNDWQNISSTSQKCTDFTNLVRQRLGNATLPDFQRGTLATEFNTIYRVGGNGWSPFYSQRDGWFTDGMFDVWFRANPDSNPNPVRAALVKYDNTVAEDFKQALDHSYGYISFDSMSQHHDPFAYAELQNIVDNGHYLNLSKARAHFGIEPLTDTDLELSLLQEAYIELCYKLAVILVRYRNYSNTV
jgi:hypothetical protein